MNLYKFGCGCSWPIIREDENGVHLDIDVSKAPRNCPAVFRMLSEGLTIGVFQLESGLGKKWTRELKPTSLEHITALGSVLRPGALNARDSAGISMTQHYCNRKNGTEPISPIHPALEPVLQKTLQIAIFQEDNMRIATEIAGFSPKDSLMLLKSMGKKKADLMSELEQQFIDGAVKVGKVTENEAREIFSYIKASARYSFNRCLACDCVVITPDGEVDICDVRVGDMVLAPTKPLNGEEFVEVLNVYKNGNKKVYEVILKNGSTVCCTLNHKLLSNIGIKLKPAEIMELGLKVVVRDDVPQEIINIIYFNTLPTYDLEVNSPNHVFYADGIAVSNSHAASYGERGYFTAYLKCHRPAEFFTSWLTFCKEDPEEEESIAALVEEARLFDLDFKVPNLLDKRPDFYRRKEVIYFGLGNIRGVGDAAVNKLLRVVGEAEATLEKPLKDFSWYELLCHILSALSITTVNGLIHSGSLEWLGFSRKKMSFEYNILFSDNGLIKTPTEMDWFLTHRIDATTLNDLAFLAARPKKEGGAASTQPRLKIMQSALKTLISPPAQLDDSPGWIAMVEEKLLGVPITYNKIDGCDTSMINATCKEIILGRKGVVTLGGEIKSIRRTTTKKGKNPGQPMAILVLSDGTGSLGSVMVFPELYKEVEEHLVEENLIVVQGEKQKEMFVAKALRGAL